MPNLRDVLRQIDDLSEDDRLRLLSELPYWGFRGTVVSFLSWHYLSGVESRPDVCGGEPCIVRTRIPVWLLEQMRRLGVSEADILHSYPTLRAEDLVHAWVYVDLHSDEIDRQIAANEESSLC